MNDSSGSDSTTVDHCNARYPKSHRLLSPSEFRHVFNNAVRAGDRAFTLLARQNDLGHARLGMAIAKKKARTGVRRNRYKRLIRESFRSVHSELPNIDVVVMIRDGAAALSNRELLAELGRQWPRLAKRACPSR